MNVYERVAAAILRQAMRDYKIALLRNSPSHITKLERFFLGEWGQFLSSNHGEYIIEQCRKSVGKY